MNTSPTNKLNGKKTLKEISLRKRLELNCAEIDEIRNDVVPIKTIRLHKNPNILNNDYKLGEVLSLFNKMDDFIEIDCKTYANHYKTLFQEDKEKKTIERFKERSKDKRRRFEKRSITEQVMKPCKKIIKEIKKIPSKMSPLFKSVKVDKSIKQIKYQKTYNKMTSITYNNIPFLKNNSAEKLYKTINHKSLKTSVNNIINSSKSKYSKRMPLNLKYLGKVPQTQRNYLISFSNSFEKQKFFQSMECKKKDHQIIHTEIFL